MTKDATRIVAAAVFFLILACAFPPRPPVSTPLVVLPPTPHGGTAPTLAPTAREPVRIYAVVLITEGGTVEVHTSAGSGSPLASTMAWDASGLESTGRAERDGSDAWVELYLPGGGSGWVDRRYLTEQVAPADFCADGRVADSFLRLADAVRTDNGRILASIVSPVHGLTVAYIHGGNPKVYDPEAAGAVFSSAEVVDWGLGPGSGLPVQGTFSDLVRPNLIAVFGAPHESHCRTIALGGASYTVSWPALWKNINYYSAYRPGSPGMEMDWMTWVAGVEYFDGAPYLFSLSLYKWEP